MVPAALNSGKAAVSPVLVADDLTGAADVGSGCIRDGWRARCVFAGRRGRSAARSAGDGEILIVDMETRRLDPREAARRAAGVGRDLARRGASPAYFKIDSTLRGNFVAEAEALRRAGGRSLVWLVPANPSFGRTTVRGRQFVDGRPLERTEYARDPVHPVRTGNIAAIVERELGAGSCARLSLRDLARGPKRVAELRRAWLRAGVRAVVADARRDRDLAAISGCVPAADLATGAGALARHMLRVRYPRPGRGHRTAVARLRRQTASGRWLAVIGSFNPLTGDQVRRAAREKGVYVRMLDPGGLGGPPAPVPADKVRWAFLALDPGLFRIPAGRRLRSASGERLARALARYAAKVIWRWKPSGLFLSGGLTAAAVFDELGIGEFTLRGEVLPGLVASEAQVPGLGAIRVLTKPGGFGSPDLIRRLTAARGARRSLS